MKITECKDDFVLYRVQNESLNDILNKFSVPISSVVRNNDNIELYNGEMLIINLKNPLVHVVKPMETLHNVAKQYNISVDEIVENNNLNSDRLFVGQKLIIHENVDIT